MSRPMSARSTSSSSGKKKKPWVRVSRSSQLFKIVDSLKDRKGADIKMSPKVLSSLPPMTDVWEVLLYQEISSSRFKFVVQFSYNPAQFCAIKMKIKSKKTPECASCQYPVKKPSEGGGDSKGGGFSKASFGHKGSADGKMKALAFMGSRKDPPKKLNYKKESELERDEKGHLMYSAAGTKELKMRKYDGTGGRVTVDQNKYEDFISKQPGLVQALKREFEIGVRSFGADEMIPADKLLHVVTKAGATITKFQEKRILDFGRYDKDGYIKYKQFVKIVNRTFNEGAKGSFHLTVKELQEMFNDADTDYSGELEADEISRILSKVHLIEDESQVQNYFKEIDKDGDQKMDFEEFMTLCQNLYKKQGGQVVANRSGPVQFNQTRTLVDGLREKVERNHLMIVHLKAQLANYDEQLETMNTIAAHSALQKELDQSQQDVKKMVRLKDDMQLAVRQWLHHIKKMHNKEKGEIVERVAVIEAHRQSIGQHRQYMIEQFNTNFHENLVPVGPLLEKLEEVKGLMVESFEGATRNEGNTNSQIEGEKELLKNGKETLGGGESFDSVNKIDAFVREKTLALEEWLVSRTQFTSADREKYMLRVEATKTRRDQFAKKKSDLSRRKTEVQGTVMALEKDLGAVRKRNQELRDKIDDPQLKREKKEMEARLHKEQEELQTEVNVLQRGSLELHQAVGQREFSLVSKREKIGHLEVELGEMKVLLDGVSFAHGCDEGL